ncbi:MAG TPA: BamA/TamA family outer membrane protein, partial [Acidobacteriota bacterium]|nr:BamA/TamA family outer membrane protein [Acidobacteriota bacterium]
FLAIHLSAVSAGFVRDGRDNPIDPRKGNYFSADLQYSSKLFGSDPDFLKSLTQFQFYSPFHSTVFATSLRLGVAREFDGPPDQLPLSQRFFAGGGRTIRGFELDTAGPLDPITGEPTGGNALFIWNLEYRFPLFGSLGAVVFFDYGHVFELISEFTFDDMRETAGLGIRYKTPIGPVTVDWGYKLDRKFEPIRESPSEFFISVGHAF